MIYMVIRCPKDKYAHALKSVVMLVDAQSMSAAIRKARASTQFMGGDPSDYKNLTAVEATQDTVIYV